MTAVGDLEVQIQRRVIELFRDHLEYTYLVNWHARSNNRNVERGLLRPFLTRQGHAPSLGLRHIVRSGMLHSSFLTDCCTRA